MNLHRWILMAVAVLPVMSLVPVGAAAATPPQETVDRLIEQLDAATLRERMAAEQALLSFGPEVLPLLPAPAR